MTQPPAYHRAFEFSPLAPANIPQAGTRLDVELDAVSLSIDRMRTNLALLQRDDGAPANQIVTYDTLATDARALMGGWTPRGAWATATAYKVKDLITTAGVNYVCVTAHTSGVFATDYAANKWVAQYGESFAIASGSLVTPTGGTTPMTLANLFEYSVNVLAFGAVGDGVTDDTAAIAAAIAKLAPTGGVLLFPPGDFLFTGIAMTELRGIRLQGCGRQTFSSTRRGTALVYGGDGASDWITMSTDNCSIADMEIKKAASVTVTAGRAINLQRIGIQGTRNAFRNVSIRECWSGISVWGLGYTLLSDVFVGSFFGEYGVRYYGELATYRADVLFLERVVTAPSPDNATSSAGFLYEGYCASVFATDCYFTSSVYGVRVKKNTAGDQPGFCRFFRCAVEACKTHGYYLQSVNFCTIADSFVGGCGLTANGGAGNAIYIGSDTRGKITLDNCDVRTAGEHGILVFPTDARVSIINPTCASNSQNTDDAFSGIYFANGCSGFQVIGGYCGGGNFVSPSETIKQQFGIAISVGCTDFQILGVNLQGNVTAPLIDSSGTTSGGIIANCIGYRTQASGVVSAVTPDANGNVLIPHGLDKTPIFATVGLNGDTPTRGVEVEGRDATNITARVFNQADGADVTAGSFNILWHARMATAGT